MSRITDIWFRSEKSLEEIAGILGLEDVAYENENYWEWVIGRYGQTKYDITRTHTKTAIEVDTRIFLCGRNRNFSEPLLDKVAGLLIDSGIAPVIYGAWIYVKGNEYDLHVVGRIS